jgi:hypothetical protein
LIAVPGRHDKVAVSEARRDVDRVANLADILTNARHTDRVFARSRLSAPFALCPFALRAVALLVEVESGA